MTPEQTLSKINQRSISTVRHLMDYFFLGRTFQIERGSKYYIFHVCKCFIEEDLRKGDGRTIILDKYACACGVKLPKKILSFVKYAKVCGYIVP